MKIAFIFIKKSINGSLHRSAEEGSGERLCFLLSGGGYG
jgi:hypothetical protein